MFARGFLLYFKYREWCDGNTNSQVPLVSSSEEILNKPPYMISDGCMNKPMIHNTDSMRNSVRTATLLCGSMWAIKKRGEEAQDAFQRR